MLISFTEQELLKIGRGMAQKQEGLMGLFEYLERAMPAAAMHAVNASGDQSEKFKGFALCLESLLNELSDSSERARRQIEKDTLNSDRPGHVMLNP